MIIMMNPDAKTKDVEYVTRRAESLGLRVHISKQDNRTLIGLHGELGSLDMNAFSGLRGVEKIQPLSRPFRVAV